MSERKKGVREMKRVIRGREGVGEQEIERRGKKGGVRESEREREREVKR